MIYSDPTYAPKIASLARAHESELITPFSNIGVPSLFAGKIPAVSSNVLHFLKK